MERNKDFKWTCKAIVQVAVAFVFLIGTLSSTLLISQDASADAGAGSEIMASGIAPCNAIGGADTTGDILADIVADDAAIAPPSSVTTSDGVYTVLSGGSVCFIDGFDTSGLSGTVTAAVLHLQYGTEGGFGPTNFIRYALDAQALTDTTIQPVDTADAWSGDQTFDLLGAIPGLTLAQIATLDIEYTNNDAPPNDDLSFDYIWINVTTSSGAAPITNITGITVPSPSKDNTPEFTYNIVNGTPEYVNFYYSDDAGASWTFYDNDTTPDGLYNGLFLLDGTYYFNTSAGNGTDTEGVPVSGLGHSEFGPYIIDAASPAFTFVVPNHGSTNVPTTAGTYMINFDEPMNTTITGFQTNLPGAVIGTWNATGERFNITYTALAEMTSYYVDLTGEGYRDPANNSLGGQTNFTFTTGDFTPPTVTSTIPIDGAIGVATIAGTYAMEFSEIMDNAVTGYATNLPTPAEAWDGTNMWFNITYGALAESITYYVDLTGQGHQDVATNPLAAPMNFTFTTTDSTSPVVISTTPVDGAIGFAVTAGAYIIDFNESMNQTLIGVTTNLPGIGVSWPDADTMQIDYTALTDQTTYFVDLAGHGHEDLSGNALTGSMNFTFTTGDFTPPIISNTVPADGATGIAITAGTYMVEFSEPMNNAIPGFTTDLPGAVGAWDGNMTFNITYTALAESTTYYVDFSGQGHEDVWTNALGGDMYKDFTTFGSDPYINYTIPTDSATGIPVAAGTYTVIFSEPMNTSITGFTTDLPGTVGAWDGNMTFNITYTAL
ncbi:MAG: Ig-like domain-containing protein, partial [Thermoplasmata archaeon]|nr:Ig-like domain-containing protein [Thermoplasmata archaeon]